MHDVQLGFGQALARVCPVELRLEEPFAQRLPARYVFRTAPEGLDERQVDVLAAVMQEFGEHGCFWSAVDWQDPVSMNRTWKPVGVPRHLDRLSGPEYLAVRSEFQPEILISEEGRWGLMAGYDLEFAIFAGVESLGMRLRETFGGERGERAGQTAGELVAGHGELLAHGLVQALLDQLVRRRAREAAAREHRRLLTSGLFG